MQMKTNFSFVQCAIRSFIFSSLHHFASLSLVVGFEKYMHICDVRYYDLNSNNGALQTKKKQEKGHNAELKFNS